MASGAPLASYWQRDGGWRDRWATETLPEAVDFAVLGGGFAGLMTALALREQNPTASILVLEAERVGFGASGRNAGFLSPLAVPVWLLGAERSADQAWGVARINAAVHDLARWIVAAGIDCELAPATLSLQPQSRVSARSLDEFTKAVNHTGLDHRVVPSRARPGHRCLELAAYTLHPYKLALGLATLAVSRGVGICERARVDRVDAVRAGGARITVGGRVLHATKVVLCTNAYTSSIELGERPPSALVVHNFMAVAEPGATLVRDGDFTVEISAAQVYHRMHGDRLIYGGIDRMREPPGGDFAVPDHERARLASHMRASFPGADLVMPEAWSGRFHTTTTGLPIVRTSETNHALVYNIGYGGTGVALSLICARLAASVASNGQFSTVEDPRLLSLMHATRISVRDSVRTLARIARGVAMPWLAT